MLKKLFFALMAACFVPFQVYAATTVVSDVSAINLVGQLTQNSGVTVTATAAVASVNQTGLVNAPLALGTVNLNLLTLPATSMMLTTGHITTGVGGNLALGGDADVQAVLGATPGFATTGTFDASSLQFSFTVPPGTTAVTMDLVFATNEVIGAVSPDTAVVMVDGVNKAVFNNGQLLSNQNAAFLFAAAPLGTIVSGYNNVSELNTLTALLDPLLTTHTVKIAIADNTDGLVDSAIIVSNFMESTSTQEGMGIGDIFPPVITPQADVVAEATGPTTAVNLGAPTVTDNVDLNPRATAAPTSPYAVGVTPVVWSSTDVAGNIGTATQTVTITDTTPPTVTAPANATFAALTAAGTAAADPAIAAWLASAVATDLVGAPALVNDAPAVFPLGSTLVTFTATDASGNIATATATVTITNQTPAVMTGPADLVVTATTAAGIPSSAFVIGYFLNSVTAVDNVDGVITLQITHDAPALFPVGVTTPMTTLVTWSVTNSGGIPVRFRLM
ncbi:MAG: hypothetical protein AUJ56_01280 [Zetaproteobacteria bacterium CG1_02_49_23]|nr:MAG: hypothetical protein AUJ56_01280 [Zetaproteobacteria bacterium CG1_02_49_23]